MTLSRWLPLIAALLLGACSQGDRDKVLASVNSLASDSNTFIVLKQAALIQFMWVNDRSSFSQTLAGLGSESTDNIKAVVAAQAAGKGYSGHLFTDIVNNEHGSALDNQTRYGLLATPEGAGGKSFLLLMDLQKANPINDGDDGKNLVKGFGEEVQYYESAEPKPVDAKWPSAAELARWSRIKMRTPQEASAQIHKLKDDYDATRGR